MVRGWRRKAVGSGVGCSTWICRLDSCDAHDVWEGLGGVCMDRTEQGPVRWIEQNKLVAAQVD